MRALVLNRELTLRPDYPEPRTLPGETLVRVRLAGICGTDLELARGYMGFRGVLGHEFVGEVVRSPGEKTSGRRVVGEINAACGHCERCAAGLGGHCAKRTVLGILGRDGCFADYMSLPDENLLPVPDSVTDELAVFTEPVAAAYEIFEQTHIARNESILVLGDGRLGALVAMMLKAESYVAVVGGHHPDKLARLSELRITALPEEALEPGFDVVIDCTGSGSGFERAMELVRPRGKIVLKSTAAGRQSLNLAPLVVNEITIVGSRCGRFAPALAALEAGRLDPLPLISAVHPLEEAGAAMAAAAQPPNFKVLFRLS